jgi:hypothetical protein
MPDFKTSQYEAHSPARIPRCKKIQRLRFVGAAAPGRPKRPARPRQGVGEATRSARSLGASYSKTMSY